jgi:hypothetical protein
MPLEEQESPTPSSAVAIFRRWTSPVSASFRAAQQKEKNQGHAFGTLLTAFLLFNVVQAVVNLVQAEIILHL